MEIKRIDHNELFKQMEEEAIKSKHYVMFKAFVGGDMDNPMANTSMHSATAYQMIQLICALKHSLDELAKIYPELYEEAMNAEVIARTHTENSSENKNNIDDIK